MNLDTDWLDHELHYNEYGEYIYTRLTARCIEVYIGLYNSYQVILN
jgi:hypothetical protein